MKIKPHDPSHHKHFAVTCRDTGRTGIDTLPDYIIINNKNLLVKFKLLKLMILLREGPAGQRIEDVPDMLKLDFSSPKYRIIALKDGHAWPSRRSKAIRAYLGQI